MNLPTIDTYGNYSSGNYGAHCLRVDFDNLTLWYSYNTIVAFRGGEYGRVVRQNDWGPTTGKHLNAIDGGEKSSRIPGEKFEKMLNETLKKLGLSN
jgi:hypothetical protein